MLQNSKVVLKTSADELFELVKNRRKISVEIAAKALKLPQKTVQALVDFLVEEKIFGLEYKFTTPYVYLSKEGFSKKIPGVRKKKFFSRGIVPKDEFYSVAKRKNIHHDRIGSLWKKYLNQNLGQLKDEFYIKARQRNLPAIQIETLWRKYLSYLS